METTIQMKTMNAMQKEAERLRKEFESYIEDLELFAKPDFWKALNEKSSKPYKNLNEYAKKMGVWMRTHSTRPRFDDQFKKLDQSIQKMILKRMQKIIEKPELGKPLHAPLNNHFSERIDKYRIIYFYDNENVTFMYLDHRDKVFRSPLEFGH